jgi:hypothetical protein
MKIEAVIGLLPLGDERTLGGVRWNNLGELSARVCERPHKFAVKEGQQGYRNKFPLCARLNSHRC